MDKQSLLLLKTFMNIDDPEMREVVLEVARTAEARLSGKLKIDSHDVARGTEAANVERCLVTADLCTTNDARQAWLHLAKTYQLMHLAERVTNPGPLIASSVASISKQT